MGCALCNEVRTALGFNEPPCAGQMSTSLATGSDNSRTCAVGLHDVCGYTQQGVPAYSNGTSRTWTKTKNYCEGFFMGYKWQCVEFARRWLWITHRLLLPERDCAYCFSSCTHVYRLKEDVPPSSLQQRREACEVAAEEVRPGPRENKDAWEKVPTKFIKQGSLVPPVADSLIVYPASCGSPWGHIGVITAVDLDRNLVYVADQNRYFHPWGNKPYSAVFRVDIQKSRFYIRDHESECTGWLTFPTAVESHALMPVAGRG